MEAYQWVIAISTATIAVALVTAMIFLIKLGSVLKKNMHFLAEDMERKVQSWDSTWRDICNLPAGDMKESPRDSSRVFPWILRGVVFATAVWRNFQKRR
jgi:uncharacterized protein YoxC